MRHSDIPRRLQDLVERELESDERVQWIGMPNPKYFTPTATAAFLFGIPWTAFALFWTAGTALAVNNGQGAGNGFLNLFKLFPLFGLPFILIGFSMLLSPIWAHRRGRNTVYVISDRRAIIFEAGWTTTIRSFLPAKLADVYRKEKRDGSGDVIISWRGWRDSDNDRRTEELGFLRVTNVKDVERQLKELSEQAKPG